MVETPLSSRRSVTGSEVPDINMANEIPDSVVAFAADQGCIFFYNPPPPQGGERNQRLLGLGKRIKEG